MELRAGVVAVPPAYTSQDCSECGKRVKKSLSTRTHVCSCGCVLDRDENAARNILYLGLRTVGHTGSFGRLFEQSLGASAVLGVSPMSNWRGESHL